MSVTEELISLFKSNVGKEEHPELLLEESGFYRHVKLVTSIFIGESRWFNIYEFIYYIPAEKRWICVEAGLGKTEYQSTNETYDAYEVFPKEVVSTKYVRKD